LIPITVEANRRSRTENCRAAVVRSVPGGPIPLTWGVLDVLPFSATPSQPYEPHVAADAVLADHRRRPGAADLR
ncbi:MAG TPA: hypothetical protein VFC59_07465, partial [Cryobacterium sp.]|nr:hypothetical protein [Cryobacterium sp.]